MAKAEKEGQMGADCGCGGECGMCAPRLAREMSYRSMEIMAEKKRTVSASNFVGTVAKNVDNRKLSDEEFRAFIRTTLPIVICDGCEKMK